ncbi:hypothetical protein BDQ12DRAFT_677926 [Crucibulum laeve]|uniref:Uncharacterized protein n=1 Tax=Crucibulum laeve TaxID=68775 RepID=A0A5C3MA32_9AGAR|nr:hypothetical protein BDQ12DRAFT_677926 [Crucibulum laeve]
MSMYKGRCRDVGSHPYLWDPPIGSMHSTNMNQPSCRRAHRTMYTVHQQGMHQAPSTWDDHQERERASIEDVESGVGGEKWDLDGHILHTSTV